SRLRSLTYSLFCSGVVASARKLDMLPSDFPIDSNSNCGDIVKKTLSTRTHICGCGTILDRDHNAARNILTKGLKQVGINLNTVGHTEIHACGQTDLYSMVAASMSKSTG
ncbi:zinc ribbon domain-containing protein, partial [Microcoleus sp. AT9_B5]